VQKYTLGPQGITHQGRFVRTDKLLAESAAGRFVRPAFATPIPDAQAIGSPDAVNTANTSVVHHGGDLMALWEGGSATRIDALTLETRGIKVWSPELAGMPFSAHPKIDRGGTLWNFGVSGALDLLTIYRIDPSGRLAQAATIKVPAIGLVHDFALTARHLVFLLPPLVMDPERWAGGASFLDSHAWQPQLGLRALVLEKDRLDVPRFFDLPAGFVFHIGNAWEDRGTIRLDCMRSDSPWALTTGFRLLMQGRVEDEGHAEVTLVELNLRDGRARQETLPHIGEFPRVDPRVVGRRYSQVFAAERVNPGTRPGFDTLLRLDVTTGRADRYHYGRDVMVEEHVFVPNRPGRDDEGDGWLLGTALDLKRREMLLSVFDARKLSNGPVVQGRMDRVMPLGLHGTFVAG
jgi:all-trans-8'-apo-beta-carotenal 15,15'-oxygenase